MGKVVGQTKLSAAAQLQLATSYNTLIKTYDPLKDKMARYKADLEQIGRINSSGLFNDKELARLNAGVAAFAQANPGFAAAMRGTVGATESTTSGRSAWSLP
jgi:hypothetical protein